MDYVTVWTDGTEFVCNDVITALHRSTKVCIKTHAEITNACERAFLHISVQEILKRSEDFSSR
jgi:hypothetical protein